MKTPTQTRTAAARNGPVQVRELLARVAGLHGLLARYFHELACDSNDPLSSFATLARWRHASVAANLQGYANGGGCRELQSWLREVPDGRVVELVEAPPRRGSSVDDLVDYALSIERAFERVYDQLQACAQTDGLRDIIANLSTLERSLGMRLNSARLELGYG